MAKKTAPKRLAATAEKQTTLVKLSSLSKAELAKINLDDLWIMKPEPAARAAAGAAVAEVAHIIRRRYCGCRDVCLA